MNPGNRDQVLLVIFAVFLDFHTVIYVAPGIE